MLFTCLLVMGISFLSLFLWHGTDVEKLVKQYPIYDLNKREYVFRLTRPEDWVDLSKISEYAQWAVVLSEDWAFYDHQGVDLNQLRVAIGESIKQAKLVRGASTITQQVIKNTILSPDRTLWRKFREMILAHKLERYLTKEKILEIYLNIVEFGENIYGVKQASHYYFDKHPSQLTAREGAFLAMLLPSPIKYGASFKQKKLTSYAKEVIDSILVKMRQAHVFSEKQRQLESSKLYYWEVRSQTQQEIADEEYLDYGIDE